MKKLPPRRPDQIRQGMSVPEIVALVILIVLFVWMFSR